MEMIHLILADDHPIVHTGVRSTLSKSGLHFELSSVYNGDELVDMLNKNKYDLLLLDINFPGFQTLENAESVMIKYPKMKVAIFSQMPEELYALRYLKIGVHGYLSKSMANDEFIRAIETIVMQGKKYFNTDLLDFFLNNDKKHNALDNHTNPFLILSNRELAVARCLKQGLDYKQIEQELNISISTIATYKTRILTKLNINTMSELFHLLHQYQL